MRERARSFGLLALALAALAPLAYYANGWPIDNRLETWTKPGGEIGVLARSFGGDEFVLARVDGFDLADPAQAAWIESLGARLASEPAVRDALDPLHLPGPPSPAREEASDRLARAAERPLVRALDLASVQPPRADFVLGIESGASPEERAELARDLDEFAQEGARLGVRLRASGHPLIAAALDAEARRVERLFGPLFALVGLLATALAVRSVWLAVASVLPAALASVAVRAGLRALEVPANMVLVAAGPLVLVLVLASVLHQVAAFRRAFSSGRTRSEAALDARRRVFRTALYAGLTTAAGFAVFGLAPVDAVRRLGLAIAAAVAVAVPLAHAFLPFLLAGLPARRQHANDSHPRRWRRLAARCVRSRAPVLTGALVLFAAGLAALPGLSFGTNSFDYFPAGHPVREAFLSIEAEGGALSGVDVLIERRSDSIGRSAELSHALAAVPGVVAVFGPDVVVDDVRAVAGPFAGAVLEPALVRAGRSDAEGRFLRFTTRSQACAAEEVRALTAELQSTADAWCAAVAESGSGAAGPDGEGRELVPALVTGSVVDLLDVQRGLVGTLASSLAGTAAFVGLCFFLATRRPWTWSSAMFVNVWPVALVLLATRLAGQSLDAATVMVSSVVMGLAVDNTFHLLGAGANRTDLRSGLAAFGHVGDAGAVSIIALVSGFGMLALSPFAPTARFGALSAVGLIAAFVGDFVLLPALLLRGRRRARSDLESDEERADEWWSGRRLGIVPRGTHDARPAAPDEMRLTAREQGLELARIEGVCPALAATLRSWALLPQRCAALALSYCSPCRKEGA